MVEAIPTDASEHLRSLSRLTLLKSTLVLLREMFVLLIAIFVLLTAITLETVGSCIFFESGRVLRMNFFCKQKKKYDDDIM